MHTRAITRETDRGREVEAEGGGAALGDLRQHHVERGRLPRRIRRVFWTLALLGAGLRIAAGTYSLGIVTPDEHQQYLEAAQGIVYGYNVTFWEYDRGVRHYFYPGLLACLLCVLDFVGLSDPVAQAMAIRILLGLAVFGSIALVAYDWLRQGRIAGGLLLMALATLSPDTVFVGARTLSGTAMIVPLMLGYYFWRRDPLVAGMLFGMMFPIRFQSAFLAATFFAVTVADDLGTDEPWGRWRSLRMAAGLAVALLVTGLIDWLTWGAWFHSPIEYFRANILEGMAAGFGTEPWYRYLEWVAWGWLGAVPVALVLLLLGAGRDWRLALPVLVYFVAHSLVAHKEIRFFWPLLPLAIVLVATGGEMVVAWLRPGWERRAGVGLLCCVLAAGAWMRSNAIDWPLDPSRGNFLALAAVGRQSDVTGVAVFGFGEADGGNYFYLRRGVPLAIENRSQLYEIRTHPAWLDGRINYLVTPPENAQLFGDVRLEEVDRIHGWAVYRVHRPLAELPEAPAASASASAGAGGLAER